LNLRSAPRDNAGRFYGPHVRNARAPVGREKKEEEKKEEKKKNREREMLHHRRYRATALR